MLVYAGFIAGTACCGLAASYESLLVARIVTGIFGGVMSSIVQTIIADSFENQFRGRVMGFIQMAFAVSQIAGIPLGLYLATHLGWNSTFYFIVIIGLINLSLIFIFMKPLTAHLDIKTNINPFVKLAGLFRKQRYLTGMSAVVFVTVGGFIIMPFSSLYLVNNIHLNREDVPMIYMFTGLANLFIMPTVGRLSDKYDRYWIFFIGSVSAAICINIYTHLWPLPLWIIIPFNIILFGSVAMRISPFMAMNSNIPEMHDRGAYLGVCSALQQTAGGLGSLIGGSIVWQISQDAPVQNMEVLGYIMTGILFTCLILAYRVSLVIKSA
jgi:predicted MFS family arabinose efflux permease